MANGNRPDLSDISTLRSFLREELGYCGCLYYEDALLLLRDTLRLLAARANAGAREYPRFTRELEALLDLENNPGMGTWFLHFLDDRDLVLHARNVLDAWPTDEGLALLAALEMHLPALVS
jgi:hypothetical protein